MSRRHKEVTIEEKATPEGASCSGNRSEHWQKLLIYGYCPRCLRAFTPPADDTKVFERLENLKKACV